MHVTSHFIGVWLDGRYFADLFVALQQYFEDHGLEHAVELQNILSLHITLYYLDGSLTYTEKSNILDDIQHLAAKKRRDITALASSYFGDAGKERVCYLSCAKNETLEEMNQFFAQKYNHSHVPENQLAFVPHVSLFRINDPKLYAPYKAEVDALVQDSIKSLRDRQLAGDMYLFQVNSQFHPEMHIPILP